MAAERPRTDESHLDAPPVPDDGVIINVEHDQADARFQKAPHKECQQCGAAIDRREPHTTAFIRVQSRLGAQHRRPAFCDVACWRAFATHDAQG